MPALRFLSVILLIVLPNINSFAQHIQERIFLTENGLENVREKLDAGYRAFVFDAEAVTEDDILTFQSFLEKQTSPEVLVFLINGQYTRFSKRISEHSISRFITEQTEMLSQPAKESRLLVLEQSVSAFDSNHRTNKAVYKNDSLYIDGGCRLLNFVEVKQRETKAVAQGVLKAMLLERGKMPNFIRTESPSLWKQGIDSISGLSFNHANVWFEGHPLNGVKWKELPRLESCGHIMTTSAKLSPKKRGYWFSPDIFSFSSSAPKTVKVFKAYQYDIKEALRYYLPFHEKNKSNTVYPYDNGTYTDVEFIDDATRGEVAYFNGETSYIDFRDAHNTDFNEITVSAWVKPDKISGSLSLIGKGEAFSAKIFNGKLQFTTPGIKDHYSKETLIKAGEWAHITYVYSQDRKVYFYVNGKLAGETTASALEQTEHSILIGTNLWGQYYKGGLSEFCVWNRALSDDEVMHVYKLGVISPSSDRTALYATGGGILIIILLFLYSYTRRKNIKKHGEERAGTEKIVTASSEKNRKGSIQLLEEFKLTDKEGNDITFRLSPKRKELLVLLILYTLKEGGISSRKMGHILWPGFSSESAKNNRSTHIKEIRNLLQEKLDVYIVYSNKVWYLEVGEAVDIDIYEIDKGISVFSGLKREIPEKEKFLEWARLVSRGPLLPQTELEWMDNFKSDYGNAVLDVLVPCMEQPHVFSDEEMLQLIRAILTIDPLFERAVRSKVNILMKAGKHTLARKTTDHYKRLYENFYGEVCEPDFLAPVE